MPSTKPADPAANSRAPMAAGSALPPGKRTLIGIAAPVVEATASEPAKATPASGSEPPPAERPIEPKPEQVSVAPKPEQPSVTPRPPPEEPRVSRAKSPLASTRKDTPEALAATRAEARARASKASASEAPEKSSRLGPILVMLVVAAAAIWFVVKKQRETAEETAAMVLPQAEPAPQEKAPEVPVAPAPTPTIEASALATASAPPAAEASAAASIAPSASAPPAASAAPAEPATTGNAASDPAPTAEGTRVVTVTMMPPDARLFWKGKSLGKSPVRIELPPGEKRRFEVGRPGYVTRRLVVDGSQSEVSIGLRPDPSAPAPSQ
jgi:hypothetical protein